MGAAVLIAKKCHQLGVRIERNVFRIFNGVEVWNEWNRDPVISRNSRVTADDYTGLSRFAPSQLTGVAAQMRDR